MKELLEEYGENIISLTQPKGSPALLIINGKTTSTKQIRQIRKALDEQEIQYNLTVKGSGE